MSSLAGRARFVMAVRKQVSVGEFYPRSNAGIPKVQHRFKGYVVRGKASRKEVSHIATLLDGHSRELGEDNTRTQTEVERREAVRRIPAAAVNPRTIARQRVSARREVSKGGPAETGWRGSVDPRDDVCPNHPILRAL